MMSDNLEDPADRQPLFPGVADHFLSPTNNNNNENKKSPNCRFTKTANDQLSKIFEVIGTPPDEVLEELLDDEETLEYAKSFPR